MKLKKIKYSILILIILSSLYGIYVFKSGSENFSILDVNSLTNIKDPFIKKVITSIEKCNELNDDYKTNCYDGISWNIGYQESTCEILKEEQKIFCYSGLGRAIGEHSSDVKTIQDECSKTNYYMPCLQGASFGLGRKLSRSTEKEPCEELEQTKLNCYRGIGLQLIRDNKKSDLCKKLKWEETCLLGYATALYEFKKDKKETLNICNSLTEQYPKECYKMFGTVFILSHGQTVIESFQECEQYQHVEECKKGVARGVAFKSMEFSPSEI